MSEIVIAKGMTVRVDGIAKLQKIHSIYEDSKYGTLVVSTEGHEFSARDIREVNHKPVFRREQTTDLNNPSL